METTTRPAGQRSDRHFSICNFQFSIFNTFQQSRLSPVMTDELKIANFKVKIAN
jgi:hypothetical protein